MNTHQHTQRQDFTQIKTAIILAVEDGNSYITFRAANGMLEFYCDTRGFINGRASTITEASTAASSVDEKNCPDHKIIVKIRSTVLAVVIFALLLALGYILYVRGRIAQIVQAKQNVKVRFATARHIFVQTKPHLQERLMPNIQGVVMKT